MSIKLLVADDSITIQKVIGIIFGGDEYSLTIVDNGKSALEKAREINPDVLLIDALMPGMSGYEVAEAVRATPALAMKPILILTGSFEPFDEDQAKRCGADDFLAKPFESQQIVTKVRDLVALSATRVQNESSGAVVVAVEEPVSLVPEPFVFADSSDFFTPLEEPVVTPSERESETALPSAPADIWDAFTPLAEAETVPAPETVSFEQPEETNVFALANAQPELPVEPSVPEPETAVQQTESQWIPVDENTFEFTEEEVVAPVQPSTTTETVAAPPDVEFGDITFESDPLSSFITTTIDDVTPEVNTPLLETPVEALIAPVPEPLHKEDEAAPPAPAAAVAAPTATSTSLALTEEQLKAAIASVSREVIERIVWEVVPDLAETLIKEAIRQIKEGR
jgi:CheY-like chemotaxis protein